MERQTIDITWWPFGPRKQRPNAMAAVLPAIIMVWLLPKLWAAEQYYMVVLIPVGGIMALLMAMRED